MPKGKTQKCDDVLSDPRQKLRLPIELTIEREKVLNDFTYIVEMALKSFHTF